LKKALLELITGVTVTPPVPPPLAGFTVRVSVVVRVKPPPVPVMVTVAAPTVAVLEAVKVTVLVPAVEAGLNAAVTPVGRPLALKATLLANPPTEVTVITLLAVAPWLTATLVGLAASEKSATTGLLTVSPIVAVCTIVPLAPVTVKVVVPTVAVLAAVSVRVLVPVVVAGLNTALTPVGKPLAANDTLPVKPPTGVIVMVVVPLPPVLIARLAGFAESAKSGGGGFTTVRLIAVVRISPPPVPVIVTVAVPVVAVLEAAKVTVLAAVVVAGLKVAVTPLGNPLALKATLLVKPPVEVTVTVLLPLAPVLTVKLAGLPDREKSGVGGPAFGSP
jgi:hypothetical protein